MVKKKQCRGVLRTSFSAPLLAVFLLLLCLASNAAAGAQPDVKKADALVKAGRADEAYRMLEPYEFQHAGEVDFDYALGIAALDSGRAAKATLAFERVLAVDPNFAGARLDMARAYFQLGDLTRAKAEFTTVLEENPPPLARQVVQRYMKAIAERENAKKTVLTGYLEGTIGHDSNVNNSTSQSQVIVPALGNLVFTLNPTNVSQADNYGLVTGGADVAREVRPNLALFGGAVARYRSNSSQDKFDYKSAEGHGGFVMTGKSVVFRTTLSAETYYLDQQHNRNTRAVAADARYTLSPTNYATGFTQYARYTFPDPSLSVNDFDQWLVGVGGLRLYREGRSAANATLFTGRENELHTRADGNKNIVGLRLGGQFNVRDDIDLIASTGWQQGRYDRQNASFQVTRQDRLSDAVVALVWRINKVWSLRPQVLYISNKSNISIYTYRRTDYSITLRRDFR